MTQQLELFGPPGSPRPPNQKRRSSEFDTPAPEWKNIFLAIFPDSVAAERILDRATRLRCAHGLTKRIRPLRHLHVSLHYLGGCEEVPLELIPSMEEICGKVAARVPPFNVTFDRVTSFRTKGDACPLVLIGDRAANAPLRELHRLLGEAL